MDNEKIQEYYYSLQGLKEILDDSKDKYSIGHQYVDEYEELLNKINTEIPNSVFLLEKNKHYSHGDRDTRYYVVNSLRAHLAKNIGVLKSKFSESKSDSVVHQNDFIFISNIKLRNILVRDYLEIQRSFVSQNWKSTIILSGGAIEAILLDIVKNNETQAKSSSKAPSEPNLEKWSFNKLIEVCLDQCFLGKQISTLSDTIREYRNLVHPGVEIRKNFKVEKQEAAIAFNVLDLIIRDLS